MLNVVINGERYVRASEANPSISDLEDAIVSQWGGSTWRQSYPDAPNYLRVLVSDDLSEGETVREFLDRLAAALGEAG